MAQDRNFKRPLSAHLQVYRLPLLAVLSITHRMTGVILSAGLLLMVLWLAALAGDQQSFAFAQTVASFWLLRLAVLVISWAMFYHMLNGLRHLIWDTRRMLSISAAELSGKIVLSASIVLTALFWLVCF